MARFVVIGTSCAGKSTFAKRLVAACQVPHVELDSLHWGPDWTPVAPDLFTARVAEVVQGEAWVIDGNYAAVRDLIWQRATTILWLDYSFPVIFLRAIKRTWHRSLQGEECCNGNRESLARAFSRDSILLWVIKTYHRRRTEFQQLLPDVQKSERDVVVLRSPAAAERWLTQKKVDASRIA